MGIELHLVFKVLSLSSSLITFLLLSVIELFSWKDPNQNLISEWQQVRAQFHLCNITFSYTAAACLPLLNLMLAVCLLAWCYSVQVFGAESRSCSPLECFQGHLPHLPAQLGDALTLWDLPERLEPAASPAARADGTLPAFPGSLHPGGTASTMEGCGPIQVFDGIL